MDLQNRKGLQTAAREHLSASSGAVRIALIYASVIVGASVLTNLFQILMDSQISRFGGLKNMGLRSVLSTLQTMLPIILNLALMALALGFTGTMLRISRGQFASPKGMKIGFDRFWVLLRATLIQGGLYLLAVLASYLLSIQLFFLTPLSSGVIKAITPALQNAGGNPLAVLEDPALLAMMMKSMVPLYILIIALLVGLAAPIFYRYRLVNYILLDKPGTGALAAMRESRNLMRGSCIKFLKLDLSMWWYYLAIIVSTIVCYGATILTLAGVELPMGPFWSSTICFAVYLVITFLITLFLQPHVEVTHALAYETLRPREQPSGGVVLGNIFNM